MYKLIRLAGKIKVFRERLGLSQKEFIEAVSEKLGVPAMNPSLASQWESNLKNRASPGTKQIKAIALLSDRPWEAIWWFMRDDLDHKRSFVLFPDGRFKVAPLDISQKGEEKLFAEVSKIKSNNSLVPSEVLTAWMRDEEKMWSLYVKGIFNSEDQNHHRRLILKENLVPRNEPCGNCGGVSSIGVKKCDYCSTLLQSKNSNNSQIDSFQSGVIVKQLQCIKCGLLFSNNQKFCDDCGVFLTKEVFIKHPSSGINQDSSLNLLDPTEQLSKEQNLVKEILSKFQKVANKFLDVTNSNFKISDLVNFPEIVEPLSNAKKFQHNSDLDHENLNNFWSAVKFFSSSDHLIPIDFFNQKIQFGDISQLVDFHNGDVSIQVTCIRPSMLVSALRRTLQVKMMELCFIDRMKKRTSTKLIVVSTYEKGLDLHRLRLEFKELRLSFLRLGVAIRFVSGPVDVAAVIARYSVHKNYDESSDI